MATFHLEISTDGAAFDPEAGGDDPQSEIARLLREKVIPKVEAGETQGAILDTWGNHCGTFWFEEN